VERWVLLLGVHSVYMDPMVSLWHNALSCVKEMEEAEAEEETHALMVHSPINLYSKSFWTP